MKEVDLMGINVEYEKYDSLEGTIEDLIKDMKYFGINIVEAEGYFYNFNGDVDLKDDKGNKISIEYRFHEWPGDQRNEYYHVTYNGKKMGIFSEVEEDLGNLKPAIIKAVMKLS